MENLKGDMPIWITKKLRDLSRKMVAAFDSGDVESAMRILWVYDAIFCGWWYSIGAGK